MAIHIPKLASTSEERNLLQATRWGTLHTRETSLTVSTIPFTDHTLRGWTSCNGPNWVDFLTTEYNRSTVLTYNLADGGATVDGDLIKPWKPEVQSLIDQVRKRYLPNYAKKPAHAPWTASNSLFGFWIGINDVGNTYWDGNSTRVNTAFKEYAELLDEV